MTTLNPSTTPIEASTENQSRQKEDKVVFMLQDEGIEAIQTKLPLPSKTTIEQYERYNQYHPRTSGPTFVQRADAVARLFHQHLLFHKRTDQPALFEELVHQFSEYWRQTHDELQIATEAPSDQIEFGILVVRKRWNSMLNLIAALYQTENTGGGDVSFDNLSIQLEILRVLHGYYNNNNRKQPQQQYYSLESPALVEYALLWGTVHTDARVLDLVLHICLKALPPACSRQGNPWFPTHLKVKAIVLAVQILAAPDTCVSLKRNACHLLMESTKFCGVTCKVFEGLDAVYVLCNLLRRRKDSGPTQPMGYRLEASQALKAILALPATV